MSFTTNKYLEQPANNSYNNTWDVPVNADWAAIDFCFGGTTTLNPGTFGSSPILLGYTSYRAPNLVVQAATLATGYTNVTYVLPSGVGGFWSVANQSPTGTPSTTSYTVTVASLGGGTSVVIQPGTRVQIMADGTNVFVTNSTAISAAGATTQVQYNNSGVLGGSANFTFDGYNVLIGDSTPIVTFSGSTDATGSLLTVTGVSGTIAAGQRVYSQGIPNGSLLSGSGPVWTITPAVANVPSQPMVALTTGAVVNGYLAAPYGYVNQLVSTRASSLAGVINITGSGSVGTMDNINIGQTTPALAKFTQAVTPAATAILSSTAFTLNPALSNVQQLSMTGSVLAAGWTITTASLVDGQTINLFITQNASTAYTLGWPTTFKWPNGTAATISTTLGAVDLLVMTYRAATGFWYCTLSKAFS